MQEIKIKDKTKSKLIASQFKETAVGGPVTVKFMFSKKAKKIDDIVTVDLTLT